MIEVEGMAETEAKNALNRKFSYFRICVTGVVLTLISRHWGRCMIRHKTACLYGHSA